MMDNLQICKSYFFIFGLIKFLLLPFEISNLSFIGKVTNFPLITLMINFYRFCHTTLLFLILVNIDLLPWYFNFRIEDYWILIYPLIFINLNNQTFFSKAILVLTAPYSLRLTTHTLLLSKINFRVKGAESIVLFCSIIFFIDLYFPLEDYKNVFSCALFLSKHKDIKIHFKEVEIIMEENKFHFLKKVANNILFKKTLKSFLSYILQTSLVVIVGSRYIDDFEKRTLSVTLSLVLFLINLKSSKDWCFISFIRVYFNHYKVDFFTYYFFQLIDLIDEIKSSILHFKSLTFRIYYLLYCLIILSAMVMAKNFISNERMLFLVLTPLKMYLYSFPDKMLVADRNFILSCQIVFQFKNLLSLIIGGTITYDWSGPWEIINLCSLMCSMKYKGLLMLLLFSNFEKRNKNWKWIFALSFKFYTALDLGLPFFIANYLNLLQTVIHLFVDVFLFLDSDIEYKLENTTYNLSDVSNFRFYEVFPSMFCCTPSMKVEEMYQFVNDERRIFLGKGFAFEGHYYKSENIFPTFPSIRKTNEKRQTYGLSQNLLKDLELIKKFFSNVPKKLTLREKLEIRIPQGQRLERYKVLGIVKQNLKTLEVLRFGKKLKITNIRLQETKRVIEESGYDDSEDIKVSIKEFTMWKLGEAIDYEGPFLKVKTTKEIAELEEASYQEDMKKYKERNRIDLLLHDTYLRNKKLLDSKDEKISSGFFNYFALVVLGDKKAKAELPNFQKHFKWFEIYHIDKKKHYENEIRKRKKNSLKPDEIFSREIPPIIKELMCDIKYDISKYRDFKIEKPPSKVEFYMAEGKKIVTEPVKVVLRSGVITGVKKKVVNFRFRPLGEVTPVPYRKIKINFPATEVAFQRYKKEYPLHYARSLGQAKTSGNDDLLRKTPIMAVGYLNAYRMEVYENKENLKDLIFSNNKNKLLNSYSKIKGPFMKNYKPF